MNKTKYEFDKESMFYTYKTLKKDISSITRNYNFLDICTIGQSVENRNIYILKIGSGPRKVFICGGTHACEWITVPVLVKWIKQICELYISKGFAYSRNIEELFERSTIHVLPMLNPDGIELQVKGACLSRSDYQSLIKWNNGSTDFSKWKANIKGVDLNRNFDAKWEICKKTEKEEGIQGPWLELYSGKHPESEPETQAIVNYTRQEDFDIVLSYHTQGQEIYWSYDGIKVSGARKLGERFARASGYILGVPDPLASYGGYKDWFIKEFKRPGYTIECGLGENPLPIKQFKQIFKENFELLLIAAWG